MAEQTSRSRQPTARWSSTRRRRTATRGARSSSSRRRSASTTTSERDARLADAGYHAVAPAMFHRAGGGARRLHDFAAVIPLFEGVTDDGILMDIDAAIGHLRQRGLRRRPHRHRRLLLRGARDVSRRRSTARSVRRVGFYGGGIVTKGHLPFEPLVDGVADDAHAVAGAVRRRGRVDPGRRRRGAPHRARRSAPVDTEVVRYEGAQHGFHCDVREDHYDADAAADAWQRTLAWFDTHLAR